MVLVLVILSEGVLVELLCMLVVVKELESMMNRFEFIVLIVCCMVYWVFCLMVSMMIMVLMLIIMLSMVSVVCRWLVFIVS